MSRSKRLSRAVAKNSSSSLDLYAKVEDLLGIKEAAPRLYAHYLLFLQSIDVRSLLDVGCGSGAFLLQMQKALEIPSTKGIDLSPLMVAQTQQLGIDAEAIELCDDKGRYDVITAVFDMLNYLHPQELQTFLHCAKRHLHEGGYFICDINTQFGFQEVAVGSFVAEDERRFVAIESDFASEIYSATFTLFEKQGSCFAKSQETIYQYYHSVESLVALSGMELLVNDEVNLYGLEESDKHFVVLRKK